MLKLFRFIIPLAALLLGSCFASRQTATEPATEPGAEPAIPIVDPVKTTLDTVTLAPGKGVIRDTVPLAGQDTLRKADPAADTLPACATDTLPVVGPDTLVVSVYGPDERLADTICIIGTGDIMPGTNYPDNSYLPPGNDCPRLFAPVADILRSADITFGNLEGVFSSEGGTPKNCRDPKTCYVFRMPDEYLDCILDAGYNLLSVANNHVNDFGIGGRLNTARLLNEAGVPFAGFVEKPSTTFEVDGVKYGFAAFAPNLGTADITDYAGAARIVAGLDSVCDIVIVSFHGGAEGRDYQHVPCTDEIYLGHNRGNVCKFAHAVVDAGADVVFGHGPHVTRAMELYKDRLICYSLGNFCTYARFNLSGPNGYAPIVKVHTNRKGEFLGGKVIPVYQPGAGGPRIDAGNHAVRLLRELTIADFPDTELLILEDGTLIKR